MCFIYCLCDLFSLYIYFLFFFFFKQKTAYEMRISDWSSDVCSSDLSIGCAPGARHIGSLAFYLVPACQQAAHKTFTVEHMRGKPAVEIGRASCRERVCQYV